MANPSKKPNYWLGLIGIVVQMGVIIYLGSWGGRWLDETYATDNNMYTVIVTLAAVAIAMYLVVKQTNKLNS